MPSETLTSLDILDVGLRGEALGYKMYDRLARSVGMAPIHDSLIQLKLDERTHAKILLAHRRDLFGRTPVRMTDSHVEMLLGFRPAPPVHDTATLVQSLYGAIRFEERAAGFYAAHSHRLPWPETRTFVEMLARQGRPRTSVLSRQLALVRHRGLALDRRGRLVECPVRALGPTAAQDLRSSTSQPRL